MIRNEKYQRSRNLFYKVNCSIYMKGLYCYSQLVFGLDRVRNRRGFFGLSTPLNINFILPLTKCLKAYSIDTGSLTEVYA